MGQTASNAPYLQTCSHLGICDPNMNTVRVDFPMREDTPGLASISEKRDAQLIPTSRVMRKALVAKQREGYVDRGMLAKAEWERQLRAKLEERERDRAEAILEAAASPEEAAATCEPKQSLNDERQKALEAIQQDLFGGRLCDRSHIPVLREEDETSTEEEQPSVTAESSTKPGSRKKEPGTGTVPSVSQYSTQATEGQVESDDSDEAMVSSFLEKHGCSHVNAKKRRFLRSTYPLHLAVQEGNPRLVTAILARGAKKEQKNSLGMTAEDVAKKSDKDGSHRQVLEALGVEMLQ